MIALFMTDEEARILAIILQKAWRQSPMGASRGWRHVSIADTEGADTAHARVAAVLKRTRAGKYPEDKEREMAISRERAKAIKRAKAALGVDE